MEIKPVSFAGLSIITQRKSGLPGEERYATKNTEGLNGQNGIPMAAHTSTTFVRCIKGGAMPDSIKEHQQEMTVFAPDSAASLPQTAHVFHTCSCLRANGLHSIISNSNSSCFVYQSNIKLHPI
jgi:hypothetical protein